MFNSNFASDYAELFLKPLLAGVMILDCRLSRFGHTLLCKKIQHTCIISIPALSVISIIHAIAL